MRAACTARTGISHMETHIALYRRMRTDFFYSKRHVTSASEMANRLPPSRPGLKLTIRIDFPST